MEKINTEIIISSLFMVGFDKVDSILYTYILGKLMEDNVDLKEYEFKESIPSSNFNKYVDYDGNIFKLKNGLSLNSMINLTYLKDMELPLYKELLTNKKLIKYLNDLDYREIILKKINLLGFDRINDFNILFSNKEKEIIYKMFGIDNMLRERSIKYLNNTSDKEDNDIDKTIKYLEKRR